MCGLKYFSSTTMFTTFNGYWTHANVWLVPVKLHPIVFYGTSLLMSSYCLSVIYHDIKVNYNCMHMHKSLCVSNRAELIRFKNTYHDSLATSLCDGTLPFYDQRHIKIRHTAFRHTDCSLKTILSPFHNARISIAIIVAQMITLWKGTNKV